jgi:hypothetical protein
MARVEREGGNAFWIPVPHAILRYEAGPVIDSIEVRSRVLSISTIG